MTRLQKLYQTKRDCAREGECTKYEKQRGQYTARSLGYRLHLGAQDICLVGTRDSSASVMAQHSVGTENLAVKPASIHSTLANQVLATNTWRQDLRSLLNNARERFADVCWSVDQEENGSHSDDEDRPLSSLGSYTDHSSTIWAHKGKFYKN